MEYSRLLKGHLMARWPGAEDSSRGAVEVILENKSEDGVTEHTKCQSFEHSTPFHEKEATEGCFRKGMRRKLVVWGD